MGHSRMILTDELFLVTCEEKEKESVSGECSSTSWKLQFKRWRGRIVLTIPVDWLKPCGIRGTFPVCLCLSAFLRVPHCSTHFCKFRLTFKYF